MADLRVLVVDDEPLVREGIRALLEREVDVRTLGEARNGREAVERIRELRPDLVLLDDLERFEPSLVLAGGRVAARDGRAEPFDVPATPAHVLGTVRSAPISAADLALDADGPVRVIEIVPEQLITIERTVDPAARTATSSATRRATWPRSP